jgi:RNA-binding protein Nova
MTTTVVAVPDEHMGAVIGRGGQTITELQRHTGVTIKVSGRDDCVAGTNHRKVTLSGAPEAVQIAQFMIAKKVQDSAAEMVSRGPN